MTFSTSYGEGVYGADGGYLPVQPSVTLEITVTAGTLQPTVWLEQVIYSTHQPSATLEQIISLPTIQPSVTLEQVIYTTAQPSVTLEQIIWDSANRSDVWSPVVTLEGTDISAKLVGTISATFEENASALATVQFVPDAGAIDLLAYVGQAVTIAYSEVSSGSAVFELPVFKGIVSTPLFIPDSGLIELRCTTDIQGRVSAMTRDEIDSVVGGYWSEHVFNADASNWEYANDRISTRPACMWIDSNGQYRVTDWAAGSAEFTFTDADRIADSVSVKRSDKSAIKNKFQITMDFRYSRQIHRNIVYRFMWQDSLCAFLKNTFKLPQRSQITSAIEGSGWGQLGSTRFYPVWPGQVVDCTEVSAPAGTKDYRVWALDILGGESEGLDQLCIGATFTLFKRWAKTLTETYTLNVVAPTSVTANGMQPISEFYGIQAETSDETWEQDTGFSRFASELSGNSTLGGFALVMPTGSIELDNGDWCYPATDAESSGRDAMENAQETVLNKCKTEILSGHRENRVNFTCRLDPQIDLSKTVRINTTRLQATGKVYSISHTMRMDDGRAESVISLAVSDPGTVGVVSETDLDPVEATVDYALSEYEPVEWVPYTIGGRVDSADYDEDADGYFSNYEFDSGNLDPFNAEPPTATFYPEQFVINTPEISEGDRQAVNIEAAQTYNVDIPNDELVEVQ